MPSRPPSIRTEDLLFAGLDTDCQAVLWWGQRARGPRRECARRDARFVEVEEDAALDRQRRVEIPAGAVRLFVAGRVAEEHVQALRLVVEHAVQALLDVADVEDDRAGCAKHPGDSDAVE